MSTKFNPFLLMSLFYFSLAVAATFGSTLVNAGLLTTIGSTRWFQVHFITLGMFTQAMLGVLPGAVAERAGLGTLRTRWDIWLVLNAGLVALLVAVPLVDRPMMIAGGTLVMAAVAMVAWQLIRVHGAARPSPAPRHAGAGAAWSYGAALAYLLLGAFVGTGLWLGWSSWLHLPQPKEVHVHSMLWGYASLLLARFLMTFLPEPDPQRPGGRRPIQAIFWLMMVGALGLTVGPWLDSRVVQAAGLVAHTAGTVWLLMAWVRAQRRERAWRSPMRGRRCTPPVMRCGPCQPCPLSSTCGVCCTTRWMTGRWQPRRQRARPWPAWSPRRATAATRDAPLRRSFTSSATWPTGLVPAPGRRTSSRAPR